SALAGTAVPVPRTVDVVDDTDAAHVKGTVFFVMERSPGIVLARPAQNAGYTADGLRGLGFDLVRCLADLHAVDPDEVGLSDFG
ncbi:phosphotransferase, partial [Stenotrophomonas sp. SrG]|uniref:phosphotransferase n=1 Tax=Stenotrophomonas sp. SrG TaxID=3414430 RepID=UPI003CE882E8